MNDLDLKDPEVLKQKLNLDTALINWRLLANYQTEDAIIQVDATLDLVNVATQFALDNTEQVRAWLEGGQISKVDEHTARSWLQLDKEMWAVVVAPWVLVQQPKPRED